MCIRDRDADGLLLNWYGPGELSAQVKGGAKVRLRQDTEYPRKGRVAIQVDVAKRVRFALKLRIPYWSERTRVALNGGRLAADEIDAGRYFVIDREWRRGDAVVVDFDFRLRQWVGEKECRGRASLFRGPVLLTYDRRFNSLDPDGIPKLDAQRLRAISCPRVEGPMRRKCCLTAPMPAEESFVCVTSAAPAKAAHRTSRGFR